MVHSDEVVGVKQESIDIAPTSLAGANATAVASVDPFHPVAALVDPPQSAAAPSSSRVRVREVIDLVDSDDEDDDDAAAVSSVATATGSAQPRVKLESALVESLPQVKLEAIAVMRGALPMLSEVQLWELLSAHGHDPAAAIQAHILAQFAIGRRAQPQ